MQDKNSEKLKRKANFRSIAVALALTAIIVLAAVLAAKLGPSAGKTESETTAQTIGSSEQSPNNAANNEVSQSGAGFPLSFSGGSIANIEAVDSNVCVLTNEMLY